MKQYSFKAILLSTVRAQDNQTEKGQTQLKKKSNSKKKNSNSSVAQKLLA